jgi:hypothetical protein
MATKGDFRMFSTKSMRAFSFAGFVSAGALTLLCVFFGATGTAFAKTAAPEAYLYSALGVEQTTATLYGAISPNGLDTTYAFVYKAISGDDPNSCTEADLQGGARTEAETLPAAGGTSNVAVRLTSFRPNTVYCYGLEASNLDGQATYGVESPTVVGFATPPPVPVVTLSQIPTREKGTISLTGTVTTEGAATSYQFSYGVNGNCGEEAVSAPAPLPESTEAQSVSTTISNLEPGERYCVELTASNAGGESSYGSAVYEFVEEGTSLGAPVIGPVTASGITQTTASITTTINPEVSTPLKSVPAGYEATYAIENSGSCEESFDKYPLLYSNFIADFPESEVTPLTTPIPVEIDLTNLTPNTTYCLLLEAFSSSGYSATSTTPLQFTTLATSTPVATPTPAPTSLPAAPKLVSPINTAAPSVRGRAISGGKLRAVNGRWSGTKPLHYTYKWPRCDRAGRRCTTIKGATKSVLKVTARDVHHRLGVIVTAHNAAGSSRKLSALTAAVETKA